MHGSMSLPQIKEVERSLKRTIAKRKKAALNKKATIEQRQDYLPFAERSYIRPRHLLSENTDLLSSWGSAKEGGSHSTAARVLRQARSLDSLMNNNKVRLVEAKYGVPVAAQDRPWAKDNLKGVEYPYRDAHEVFQLYDASDGEFVKVKQEQPVLRQQPKWVRHLTQAEGLDIEVLKKLKNSKSADIFSQSLRKVSALNNDEDPKAAPYIGTLGLLSSYEIFKKLSSQRDHLRDWDSVTRMQKTHQGPWEEGALERTGFFELPSLPPLSGESASLGTHKESATGDTSAMTNTAAAGVEADASASVDAKAAVDPDADARAISSAVEFDDDQTTDNDNIDMDSGRPPTAASRPPTAVDTGTVDNLLAPRPGTSAATSERGPRPVSVSVGMGAMEAMDALFAGARDEERKQEEEGADRGSEWSSDWESEDDAESGLSSDDSSSSDDDDEQHKRQHRNGMYNADSCNSARHRFLRDIVMQDLPPRMRLIIRSMNCSTLDLSHQGMGDEIAVPFAKALSNLPNIKQLNLTDNKLTDLGIEAVLLALQELPEIFVLRLGSNVSSDIFVPRVLRVLLLRLSGLWVGTMPPFLEINGMGAERLASYLGAIDCPITALHLANADIEDSECVKFIEALHTNCFNRLTALDMSSNLIGKSENLNVVQPDYTTGAEAIAEFLTSDNCKIKTLDLSWNYIRLDSARQIGDALAQNKVLADLNLSYNTFADMGSEGIVRALRVNTALTHLDLSYNNLTPKSAFTLAQTLMQNKTLRELQSTRAPWGKGPAKLIHRQIDVNNCCLDIVDARLFDATEPAGSYVLHLNDTYESSIAKELLLLTTYQAGCSFKRVTWHAAKAAPGKPINLTRTDHFTILRRSEEKLAERAKACFRQLDSDGSNDLTHAEIEDEITAIERGGGVVESSLLYTMIQECYQTTDPVHPFALRECMVQLRHYDHDGDGKFSETEFMHFCLSIRQGSKNQSPPPLIDQATGKPWEVPTAGVLKVEFERRHVESSMTDVMDDDKFDGLLHNMLRQKTGQAELLHLLAKETAARFSYRQSSLLMRECSKWTDKVPMLAELLARVPDSVTALMLVRNCVHHDADLLRLQRIMGAAFSCVVQGNTTGVYTLDLSKYYDRIACIKIMQTNKEDRAYAKTFSQRLDTSQHQNWSGIRNETMNDKPFVWGRDRMKGEVPRAGKLRFSYVSSLRPPPSAKPVDEEEMKELIEQTVKLMEGFRFGKKKQEQIKIVHSFRRLSQEHARHGRERDSLAAAVGAIGASASAGAGAGAEVGANSAATESHGSGSAPKRTARRTSTVLPRGRRGSTVGGATGSIARRGSVTGDNGDSDSNSNGRKGSILGGTDRKGSNVGRMGHGRSSLQPQEEEPPKSARTLYREVPCRVCCPYPCSCGNKSHLGSRHWTKEEAKHWDDSSVMCEWEGKVHQQFRCLVSHSWFSAEQCAVLVAECHPAVRTQAYASLFSRIVDLEGFGPRVLDTLPFQHQMQLVRYLGCLNCYSPQQPERMYDFDLACKDERLMAQIMVNLIHDEHGENIDEESYAHRRNAKTGHKDLVGGDEYRWHLPVNWRENGVPTKGIFFLRYQARQGLNQQARDEIMRNFLVGSAK